MSQANSASFIDLGPIELPGGAVKNCPYGWLSLRRIFPSLPESPETGGEVVAAIGRALARDYANEPRGLARAIRSATAAESALVICATIAAEQDAAPIGFAEELAAAAQINLIRSLPRMTGDHQCLAFALLEGPSSKAWHV